MTGGFHTHRCQRCGMYWCSNSSLKSIVSTAFCPTCIPAVTTVLADDRRMRIVDVAEVVRAARTRRALPSVAKEREMIRAKRRAS